MATNMSSAETRLRADLDTLIHAGPEAGQVLEFDGAERHTIDQAAADRAEQLGRDTAEREGCVNRYSPVTFRGPRTSSR